MNSPAILFFLIRYPKKRDFVVLLFVFSIFVYEHPLSDRSLALPSFHFCWANGSFFYYCVFYYMSSSSSASLSFFSSSPHHSEWVEDGRHAKSRILKRAMVTQIVFLEKLVFSIVNHYQWPSWDLRSTCTYIDSHIFMPTCICLIMHRRMHIHMWVLV